MSQAAACEPIWPKKGWEAWTGPCDAPVPTRNKVPPTREIEGTNESLLSQWAPSQGTGSTVSWWGSESYPSQTTKADRRRNPWRGAPTCCAAQALPRLAHQKRFQLQAAGGWHCPLACPFFVWVARHGVPHGSLHFRPCWNVVRSSWTLRRHCTILPMQKCWWHWNNSRHQRVVKERLKQLGWLQVAAAN